MSKRSSLATFALIALLACAWLLAADPLPIPALSERVTDLTATLAAPERASLAATLAALEARKGAQVAILIVPTTAPETIEQYATRVYDAWKLGRSGVDDGALILVAKEDHRVRIEVAYGLEGAIPDAAAKRIAHDYMSPRFREGDFAGGLTAGVEMLRRLIDEEPLPEPPAAPSRHASPAYVIDREPWWSPVVLVVGVMFGALLGVVLLLVVVFSRAGYRLVLGHFPSRVRCHAFAALVALPITLLLRHPAGALGAFAAASAVAALAHLAQPPRRRDFARSPGAASGVLAGSWSPDSSSGGSSSSSSDSGSSSAGDFSGGGGSSGGGGASDSW